MNGISSNIFKTTMTGLETGLQILHITTFELQYCASDDDIITVLKNPDLEEFDQVPVRKGSRIMGVVEKALCTDKSGSVEKCMRPLDDSILVSAQTPLVQFIPLMENSTYRLVLGGGEDLGIRGIVTRSDLLKLPVRLYAFSLVTHLELLMSEVISTKFSPNEDPFSLLSEGRRTKLDVKMNSFKERNFNPPLLELTDFCDKREILKKQFSLGKGFRDDLEDIEELRNKVAHAGNYASDDAEMQLFIKRLSRAEHWIQELTHHLK
jgi:predicted transcriptional regulator